MANEVEENINKKLVGTTLEELFEGTDASVFGGSVRDTLADLPIHDVDIVALYDSAKVVGDRLIKAGYHKFDVYAAGIVNMYKDMRKILEPHTYIKDKSMVQVIRPILKDAFPPPGTDFRKRNEQRGLEVDLNPKILSILKKQFIGQVDLSCCAVSYSPNEGLEEHIPDAASHAKMRYFRVLKDNILHHEKRIFDRTWKLEKRGWKDVSDMYGNNEEDQLDKTLSTFESIFTQKNKLGISPTRI